MTHSPSVARSADVFQPLSFWTLTPSFTLLNFRYPDALLNSSAYTVGATNGGGTVTIGGVTYPVTVTAPGEQGCATIKGGPTAPQLSSATLVGGCPFGPNGVTNSTYIDANGNAHFLSGFLYADLILNNQFKTGLPRLPINLLAEYEDNLNAAAHPYDYTATGLQATSTPNTSLGSQSKA